MIRIIDFATGFQTDELPGTAVDANTIAVTPAGDLSSTNVQAALEELQGDIDVSEAAHAAHLANLSNPHAVTKAQVGLGNVDNTSDATKNAATATLTNKTLTAPAISSPTGLVKADVGLGNVDNTSDATKNAATATLTNKTLTSPTINSPTVSSPTFTGATIADALDITQVATPSAPTTGKTRVYSKSDGKIYKFPFGGAEAEIGSGGLTPVAVSSVVALASVNTMYLASSTGGFQITCPPIPASGGMLGFVDAAENCSATNYIRLHPGAGQSFDGLPVNDTLTMDYPRANLTIYAAPGATSWKVQYQTTSMVQGGQVPGSTTGSATGSGFIGEMFGTLRSGTGGFTQTTRTTTGLTTTPSNVVSFTLNKGVYMVGGFTNLLGSGTSNARYRLYIGGTMVVVSTASTIASSTQASTLYMPGVPVNITTDGTVVAFFGSVDAGTATAENEAWCIRVG